MKDVRMISVIIPTALQTFLHIAILNSLTIIANHLSTRYLHTLIIYCMYVYVTMPVTLWNAITSVGFLLHYCMCIEYFTNHQTPLNSGHPQSIRQAIIAMFQYSGITSSFWTSDYNSSTRYVRWILPPFSMFVVIGTGAYLQSWEYRPETR